MSTRGVSQLVGRAPVRTLFFYQTRKSPMKNDVQIQKEVVRGVFGLLKKRF